MTATIATTRTLPTGPTTRTARPLAGIGVVAAAVASAATMTVAAVGHAAGISLVLAGAPIPVPGFGLLTAMFSLIGLAIAIVLRRTAQRSHGTFVRVTVLLTTISLIPDAVADAAVATKALLMLTHLVAAAIVIPALARRLPA